MLDEEHLLDLLTKMNGRAAPVHGLLRDIQRVGELSTREMASRIGCNDARMANITSKKLQLQPFELRNLAALMRRDLGEPVRAFLTSKYPALRRARPAGPGELPQAIFENTFGRWFHIRDMTFRDFNHSCAGNQWRPERGHFLLLRLDRNDVTGREQMLVGRMRVWAGGRDTGLAQFTTYRRNARNKPRITRGAIFQYRGLVYSIGGIENGGGFRFTRLQYVSHRGRAHLRGIRLANSRDGDRPHAYRLFAWHLAAREGGGWPMTKARVDALLGAMPLNQPEKMAPLYAEIPDLDEIIAWLRVEAPVANGLDSPPFD